MPGGDGSESGLGPLVGRDGGYFWSGRCFICVERKVTDLQSLFLGPYRAPWEACLRRWLEVRP